MMTKLLAEEGVILSEQTVRKYMNLELGLKSVTRTKKFIHKPKTKEEPYSVFENLLKQDFTAERKNQRWCMDFTYVFFGNHRKRYNCTIIDLYNRAVVASVNSNKIDANLAIAALKEAFKRTGGEVCELIHSDRGSQFTSKKFVEFCKEYGIKQSMSKPGYPYDNAPMERYYNTLKAELIKIYSYDTEEALYDGINNYAYGWYNNVRPHSFNGGKPPMKVK